MESSPPASGSPCDRQRQELRRRGRRDAPRHPAPCATWPNSAIQASRSDEPLLEWAMATGLPSGVTTMSISSWTRDRLCSSTIIANTEVPAETFPERGRTAFVATMPVPASPSGGHSGMPGTSVPEGSSSFAPSARERCRPGGPRAGRRGGCRAASSPVRAARSGRRSARHPRGVPVIRARVDGEHARGLAHADSVLAGEAASGRSRRAW